MYFSANQILPLLSPPSLSPPPPSLSFALPLSFPVASLIPVSLSPLFCIYIRHPEDLPYWTERGPAADRALHQQLRLRGAAAATGAGGSQLRLA